jgi:hypothetical protein
MTNLVQKYANPKVETEAVEMRGIEAHQADRGPSQKDQLGKKFCVNSKII